MALGEVALSQSKRQSGLLSTTLRPVASCVAASPFLMVGFTLALNEQSPSWVVWVLLVVGLLIFFGGWLYLTRPISLPELAKMSGEDVIDSRHPSMKPPVLWIVLSLIPFLATAFTVGSLFGDPSWEDYVVPIGSLVVGFFLYLIGVTRYWLNHYTIYYVTTLRVVRMYEFMQLDVQEIPIESINSISEKAGLSEIVTRRGSVVVASGIGPRHILRIQAIDNPKPMARAIRELRYETER